MLRFRYYTPLLVSFWLGGCSFDADLEDRLDDTPVDPAISDASVGQGGSNTTIADSGGSATGGSGDSGDSATGVGAGTCGNSCVWANDGACDDGGAGALTGKKFVLTGSLSIPRAEAKKRIEAAGGKLVSSVSKKTDYVLAGENAGSKHDKALSLGVEILDEEAFEALLQGAP